MGYDPRRPDAAGVECSVMGGNRGGGRKRESEDQAAMNPTREELLFAPARAAGVKSESFRPKEREFASAALAA
jgi:hypothetical protein